MPLDDTTKHYEQALAQEADPLDYRTFSPGLEGLRKLAWVLRHPEVWPKSHTWSFSKVLTQTDCGTIGCAIGLATEFWHRPNFDETIQSLAMTSNAEITNIFAPISRGPYGKPNSRVTPDDVASAIDSYLARAEALAKSEAGGTP